MLSPEKIPTHYKNKNDVDNPDAWQFSKVSDYFTLPDQKTPRGLRESSDTSHVIKTDYERGSVVFRHTIYICVVVWKLTSNVITNEVKNYKFSL